MSDNGYQIADIYADLRSQVLQLKPSQSISPLGGLIAVLMETGYPEAVATLVAVSDGTVSLYFSNGGGTIGAGEHDVVREAGRRFLESAKQLVLAADRADTFPLPGIGRVRFYLVTVNGTYTADALEEDLGYDRHGFSPLFQRGHELITAVREHTPQ